MSGRAVRTISQRSLAVSMGLHLAALFWVIFLAPVKPAIVYQPLAVVDFLTFDPHGGDQPGAEAEPAELTEVPLTDPAEPSEANSEIEPEPVERPVPLESLNEQAEPAAPPPPPVENKPKAKPAPKPALPVGVPAGESAGPAPGGDGGGLGLKTKNALKAYQSLIRRRLERYKKYPAAAQAQRITGTSTVVFTVHRDGTVSGVRLSGSAGHNLLDDEALALLRRVAPLPPIPAEIASDRLNLNVPIVFAGR